MSCQGVMLCHVIILCQTTILHGVVVSCVLCRDMKCCVMILSQKSCHVESCHVVSCHGVVSFCVIL